MEKEDRLAFPMRRILPEILADIFLWLVVEQGPFLYPSVKLAPLLLCQVCSFWRDVAIGTSFLWAGIDIHLRTHGSDSPCIWLDRAKVAPLSVSLSYSGIFMDPNNPRFISITPLLKYFPKCRQLTLNLTTYSLQFVLQRVSAPFTCLETLNLQLDNSPDNIPSIVSTSFISASSLRHFSLISPLGELHARDISLSWSNLTSLTIFAIRYSAELIAILSQCTSLETCEITLSREELMTSSGPYVLPKLLRLTLGFAHNNLIPFLSSLILPSLEYLFIKCYDASNPPTFALHSRFSTNLQYLHLESANVTPQDLESIFRANPRIRVLELDSCEIFLHPGFYELLTYKEIDSVLPKLERLSLGFNRQSWEATLPPGVVDMIESRWCSNTEGAVCRQDLRQLSRLQVFDMHWLDSKGPDLKPFLPYLERFREEGLRLSW